MRAHFWIYSFFIIIFILHILSSAASASDVSPVIVIDAGHGGEDGGTVSGIRYEKEYNLILAEKLKDALEKDGRFTVIMTREDDTYLKFLERAMFGYKTNADLILSLHCNSSYSRSVYGSEAYISLVDPYSTEDLADAMLKGIEKSVGIEYGEVDTREDTGDSYGVYYWNEAKKWDMPGSRSLGQKSDYYSMLTWGSKFGIPAIILEHGYLSNRSDRLILDSDANLKKISESTADAIIEYYFGHTHTFTAQKTVDMPSNCTLLGSMSYRCTYCGIRKSTTQLTSYGDHYWRQEASANPTCTKNGYITYVCQISFNLNDKGYETPVHRYTETLKSPGHSFITYTDTQPTHAVDGKLHKVCSRCGYEVNEIRKSEPHGYEITSSTPPTCEKKGIDVHSCRICGDSYAVITPELGHDYKKSDAAAPTYTEDGYLTFICSRCGSEKVIVLPKCDHEFERTVTEPTCTDDGSISDSCKKCDYVITEPIAAAGHSYILTEEISPECETAGSTEYTCQFCGDIITDSISPTGHTYVIKEEKLRTVVTVCPFCGSEAIIPNKEFPQPILIAGIAGAVFATSCTAAMILIYKGRKRT